MFCICGMCRIILVIFFSSYFGICLRKPGEPIAQSSPIPNNVNGYQNGNGNYSTNDGLQSTDLENNDQLERGRSRKKRDFFGTLKRRLGRSKSRAKSLERSGAIPINAENPTGKKLNILSLYHRSIHFFFFHILFRFYIR